MKDWERKLRRDHVRLARNSASATPSISARVFEPSIAWWQIAISSGLASAGRVSRRETTQLPRKNIAFGLALVAILVFAGFAFWGGNGWDHTSVTVVVPGENGETLVITDNDRPGFVPFFPIILFFQLLLLLVIGEDFSAFGRRRWGGTPFCGPDRQNLDTWLADWHRRYHRAPEPNVGEMTGIAENTE